MARARLTLENENSDDEFSDSNSDDKPSSSKKGLAGVTIKKALSLFSTPHCLMEKGDHKVTNNE